MSTSSCWGVWVRAKGSVVTISRKSRVASGILDHFALPGALFKVPKKQMQCQRITPAVDPYASPPLPGLPGSGSKVPASG